MLGANYIPPTGLCLLIIYMKMCDSVWKCEMCRIMCCPSESNRDSQEKLV